MIITNRKHIAVAAGLLSVGAAFGVTSPALAAPRNNDVREERREAKQARQEVRQERQDVRQADTRAERREEKGELKEAKRDLKRERQDVREERREANRPPYGNANGYYRNRPVYNPPVYNPPVYNYPTYNYPTQSYPTYNPPVYNYPNYNTPGQYGDASNGQRIDFTGTVLDAVNGGSSFRVRADNGAVYTVRTPRGVYINRGQRARVSGDWWNGTVNNAGVNFI